MTLNDFNRLDEVAATEALKKCCGSTNWASQVAENRPFETFSHLTEAADKIWATCVEDDFLEAFSHHPMIGNLKSLEEKFASTANWSSNEQGAVNSASKDVLVALRDANIEYREKFGFIFIVCATGKSAQEMLDLLLARLPNERPTELANAAEEQRKITHIRLNKMLEL